MPPRWLPTLFSPDEPPAAPPATDPPPARPAEGLQRLIDRQGSADAVAVLLYNENYQLRERNRQLQAQQPGQGTVVLSAEQAAAWAAYQQLGAPDALRTALSERDTARADLTRLQREAQITQAAGVANYKPNVLARLLNDETLDIREANGQRTVIVRHGETETPLADYAQQHWAEFLPALSAAPAPPSGAPFVPQAPAGTGAPTDPVSAFINRSNERRATGNPLTKKPQ